MPDMTDVLNAYNMSNSVKGLVPLEVNEEQITYKATDPKGKNYEF